jgi:hypothetical protein
MISLITGFCLVWLWSICSANDFPQENSNAPPPIEVEESKSVLANGVLFTTVTEAKWRYSEYSARPMKMAIAIHLRISNQTKEKLAFVTNGTFLVILKDKDGKEIKPKYTIDVEAVQSPIILPSGATFSIMRDAYLIWDSKKKSSSLEYFDGSGACRQYPDLVSGRHTVSFIYSTKRFASSHLGPIGHVRVWEGEAKTSDVPFEIVNPNVTKKNNK